MFVLLAALGAPASAAEVYTSEIQHVVLADDANVFAETEIDSGWLPSDSPVQVRFQIKGLGASAVLMEGDADLFWPTNLNLSFYPEPGSGELNVNASLAAVTSVRFDVFGFEYESVIDSRGLDVRGEQAFEPFALADQPQNRVVVADPGVSTELISYQLEVFAGVGLEFRADMNTLMEVGFEGDGWQIEDTTYAYSTDVVNFPAAGQPYQEVVARFLGWWDSAFSLVLTPAILVDAGILGSYEVFAFELPIPLATSGFQQAMSATTLRFPLPVLETSVSAHDFGSVEVGQLANLEVDLRNLGELDLEGVPALTGSPYFTMYPPSFQAGPGLEDGLVVTFAPGEVGTFDATLLLVTNDPAHPTLEIPLSGAGFEEEVPETDGGSDDTGLDDGTDTPLVQTEVKGCGCASGGAQPGALAAFPLLLGAVALARRTRREGTGRA